MIRAEALPEFDEWWDNRWMNRAHFLKGIGA